MDPSKSPAKSLKQSQPRGVKAESSKSLNRCRELPIKDEHNVGQQGNRGPKTSSETPDKKRGRPTRVTRLTGRASSGERGKGKVAGPQQQATESMSSLSPDSSPCTTTETSSPVVPSTPEKGLAQQNKGSIVTPAKCQGVKPAAAMHQSMDGGSSARPAADEGPLTEQQLGLRQAEERLYRDYIHRLVKQSPEYPNFQYLCKLCSVHIENIQGAHKHIKEKRHKKNIMEKQEVNELRALPPPSAAQLKAVDAAVLETARQHGVSEEDVLVRTTVVSRMEEIIKKHLPACSLRLYGSCLTRFAFKTSDINIDVTHPSSMTQPEVLIQVLEILKNCAEFSEVESDFHAKVPAVFCHDVKSGLLCKVSAGNDVACLTTNHLATLAKLEPRLVPLVLAFRHWARLCHIDCQAEGGIPSYSFALMVIFFLQQRKEPILPVYLGHWIEGFHLKHVDEYHLTGISLDMFVRWEHRPPASTEERGGENRTDPRGDGRAKQEHRRTEDTDPVVGLVSARTLLMFVSLLTFNPRCFSLKSRLTLNLGKGVSLGQLWLELLRFYTLEFALEEYIISIRVKELLSREMKNWPRRRLAIEDPFALKRNVARSLNSQMVFEYIQERFRAAYKYFACPQRRGQSRKTGKPKEGSGRKESPCVRKDGDGRNLTKSAQEGQRVLMDDGASESDDQDSLDGKKTLEAGLKDLALGEEMHSREKPGTPSFSPNGLLDSDNEDQKDASVVSGRSEELHYVFDKMSFTGGKPPTVVCSICKRDGHLKDECPEDFKKIELKPLPPMNDRFRDILDRLTELCYSELSPSHVEQQKREQILASLERFIRKEYNDKAKLCLFGSSKNGFGFHDSDLDICMTLEGHETAENLNCKDIIEGLAKVLKKHTGLRNILPITTAKVPIVKFEHRQSGLEGDISLYNTLAQHNTRMLATYAALDTRVQYLGFTMKFFAKRCDIGDASRGSLSSYAYILMVLYFLQQRQPPVIPVLQEIFDGDTAPQRMVDGWNAYFFDDLDNLRQRLSQQQPNTESVGELWLGLLRFYTEEFDFKEHVISIRQRKRLTTFEKQWTSKCIAIEGKPPAACRPASASAAHLTHSVPADPFDLNHNLGAGVSRKMTNFIMKAFINGRKLFGTPFFPICGHEAAYFFDSRVLTDGELAPNDRCCRICGKIGHYMKDCPKRRRIKKKENDKEEDVKEDEREQKDRRCFQCGDMGHVRRDCPEYRHLKQRPSGPPAPHMVRTITNSQSIPVPQTASDGPGRTRLSSECSDTRQTPPYSPQPTPQTSSSSPQSSHSKSSASQKQPVHHQVPLSLFGFPNQHPAQYHAGTLTALGLLPSHQPQPHHPLQLPATSWPIHGPVLTSSSPTGPSPPGFRFAVRPPGGNGTPTSSAANPMNLNDPSIIFAQPAGRQLGVGGSGRDGHWHNHMAQPGALMGNGSVVKSDSAHPPQFVGVTQGSRTWEHSKTSQYSLPPSSWSFRMPHNFIQQGNGGFQPGSMVHPGPGFPLVPHVRHPVNLNFIQQKK
ncbi:terminal uridylyltransferase 4 [Neosynchiropus ocellatus]